VRNRCESGQTWKHQRVGTAIDALVRRLRDRLAEVDPGHNYIVTVRGHGFRFDNSP
jgi:DNA-binding response OmpR family regulator